MSISSIHSNMVSNLVSNWIVKQFKLDMNYAFTLTTLISSILISIDMRRINYYYIFYSILCGYCIYLLYNWYNKPHVINKVKYITLDIYSDSIYKYLHYYKDTNPTFFDKNYSMEIQNPKYHEFADEYIPSENTPVHFNDITNNIKGFFTVIATESPRADDGESKKTTPTRYVSLSLEKGQKYNCEEYINILKKYYNKKIAESNELTLYYAKVFAYNDRDYDRDVISKNHIITMYNGALNNKDERYKLYIKSYFSKNRDKLWNYLSDINYHPEKFSCFGQEARCNLLLYGPPGSGKSSFAYRIAMALGRHLISVDITSLVTDKVTLYQLLQNPKLGRGETISPDKCIILLEEFDIAVKFLAERAKKPFSPFLKKKRKETDKSSEDDEQIIFNHWQASTTRNFQLEDLLEILQGPVPIKGSIIMATTNKYAEIKQLCPALFRPGRMTPIEFNYIDYESLQEMTKYYFGKELPWESVQIKIPTSEIIEIALHASLQKDGFNIYKSQLQHKLTITE